MSASQPAPDDLPRGDSLLSNRAQEVGRAVLAPDRATGAATGI